MTELLRMEARIKEAVRATPSEVRQFPLRILRLPDEDRARGIGELYQSGTAPELAELLIDLEEDRAAMAVLVGELALAERRT